MYEKLNVGEDQNQYVRYASKISNNDLHFLATLEAENGLWTHDRLHDKSYYKYSKVVHGRLMPSGWYSDYGFCGTSNFYYWNIVEDENFLSNPQWQIEKCYELYKGGTTFYGKKRLEKNPDFKREIYNRFALR